MYLIMVMARTIYPSTLGKRSQKELPEHDLKPVLVAINRKDPEYFVREHDSRRYGSRQDEAYRGIARVFCRLSECDNPASEKDDRQEDMVGGRAQMAVCLATVVVPAAAIEPEGDDFVQYVADRSRLADRIVVVGYTGNKLSMKKSEILAIERARAVKAMLLRGGIKAPITAIARPKCNYSRLNKLSHRVEVTALFFSNSDAEKKEAASGKHREGKAGRQPRIGAGTKEAADE